MIFKTNFSVTGLFIQCKEFLTDPNQQHKVFTPYCSLQVIDYNWPLAPASWLAPAVMDLKDRRQRSLTRGQCRKDVHYATSSMDGENCHIVSQRSYSSSKTLKAYQQDGRLRYGGCVAELVHQEKEQYVRQGESSYVAKSFLAFLSLNWY